MVFSEIYYPEWTATVDGKPVEIGRADYVLRALKVDKGQHQVHPQPRAGDRLAYLHPGDLHPGRLG